MAVNKVEINGEVKLDLTGDTVTADTLAEGYTAHNAAGEVITGTMAGGGSGGDADALFIAYIESEAGAGITELPNGVTRIGSYTFFSQTDLELTSLPKSLISIGESAFEGCSSLALTELPENVTTIETFAFADCGSLEQISLSGSVATINAYAFKSCNALTTVVFRGTPQHLHYNVFNSCSRLKTIKVPWAEGAIASAPWGATNATITYNYTGD